VAHVGGDFVDVAYKALGDGERFGGGLGVCLPGSAREVAECLGLNYRLLAKLIECRGRAVGAQDIRDEQVTQENFEGGDAHGRKV